MIVQFHVADLADPGDIAELERVVADLVGVHVLAVSRLAKGGDTGHDRARVRGDHQRAPPLAFTARQPPPRPLPCRAVYAGAKAF